METSTSALAGGGVRISYYGYRSTALSDSKEKTDVRGVGSALIADLERSASVGDEKEVLQEEGHPGHRLQCRILHNLAGGAFPSEDDSRNRY